jgi:acyl dehydratase
VTHAQTIQVGDVFTAERTFTVEDVEAFVRVSRDVGRHHLERDEQGRLLVHGLLTASLPAQIGGSIDYIAREMLFEFIRPVFTGDTVRAELRIDEVEKDERQTRLSVTVVCKNQHGKEVLKARSNGIILNR